MTISKTARNSWPYLLAALLILFRCVPYLLYGNETLSADEAVWGLMAKHLSELRAFPVFGYGTKYCLGVSSWLAAPFFAVFGPSVALLRLPLLFLNLFVGFSLIALIQRNSRLTAASAFLCTLWFLLPSTTAANGWMDANGASIETLAFSVLVWMLRGNSWIGGFVSGIGIANRPFVLYAVAANLLLEWRQSSTSRLQKIIQASKWIAAMAASWITIQILAKYSTDYFGVSSPVHLKPIRLILEDTRNFLGDKLPRTLGMQIPVRRVPIPGFPFEGTRYDWAGAVLAIIAAVLLLMLVHKLWVERKSVYYFILDRPEARWGSFLVLTGLFSWAGFALLSPAYDDLRFTYQLILGMVGLYVLQRQLPVGLWAKRLSIVLLLGSAMHNFYWLSVNWADLSKLGREHPTANLLAYLKEHDIRAATADYWISFNLSFLTNEKTVATGVGPGARIPQEVATFMATPVRNRADIRFAHCEDGVAVGYWYVCPYVAGRP